MTRGASSKRAATDASLSPRKSKTPKLVDEGLSVRLLEIIDRKYEKIAKAFDSKFQSISDAMETAKNDILLELAHMREEMQTIMNRVSTLENEVQDLKGLRSEVELLTNEIEVLQNKSIDSELRILGVPFTQGENLNDVFGKICAAVNTETPNTTSIYRVKRRESAEGPIIVKLASAYCRNQFMRSMAHHRRNTNKTILRLTDIGFQSDIPIYVNENLTAHNSVIMRAATKFKKEKKIVAAYTLRGHVYIKLQKDNPPIATNSMDALNNIISNFFRDV